MPTYAIISVGAGNAFGHPTEEVLSRLRDADVQVFRTDLQGQITLMCFPDGRITVSTERNASTSDLFSAKTVATAVPTERKASLETDIYIGNKNSKKLHYPACQSVADMKESNKVVFHSRDEAISQGYVSCQNCNL